MQIDNGVARISVSYSLKVPDPTVPYASESMNLSTSLEFPADGDVEQVLAQGRALEASIFKDLQLSVFAHLGVEDFTELPNGRLVPKITPPPEKPKKSYSGGKSSGGGGGGGNFGKPKADPSDIPTHSITLDGESVKVQDLRGLKADGTYKNTAPDFRIGGDGVWAKTKEGGINPKAQAIMDAIDKDASLEAPF